VPPGGVRAYGYGDFKMSLEGFPSLSSTYTSTQGNGRKEQRYVLKGTKFPNSGEKSPSPRLSSRQGVSQEETTPDPGVAKGESADFSKSERPPILDVISSFKMSEKQIEVLVNADLRRQQGLISGENFDKILDGLMQRAEPNLQALPRVVEEKQNNNPPRQPSAENREEGNPQGNRVSSADNQKGDETQKVNSYSKGKTSPVGSECRVCGTDHRPTCCPVCEEVHPGQVCCLECNKSHPPPLCRRECRCGKTHEPPMCKPFCNGCGQRHPFPFCNGRDFIKMNFDRITKVNKSRKPPRNVSAANQEKRRASTVEQKEDNREISRSVSPAPKVKGVQPETATTVRTWTIHSVDNRMVFTVRKEKDGSPWTTRSIDDDSNEMGLLSQFYPIWVDRDYWGLTRTFSSPFSNGGYLEENLRFLDAVWVDKVKLNLDLQKTWRTSGGKIHRTLMDFIVFMLMHISFENQIFKEKMRIDLVRTHKVYLKNSSAVGGENNNSAKDQRPASASGSLPEKKKSEESGSGKGKKEENSPVEESRGPNAKEGYVNGEGADRDPISDDAYTKLMVAKYNEEQWFNHDQPFVDINDRRSVGYEVKPKKQEPEPIFRQKRPKPQSVIQEPSPAKWRLRLLAEKALLWMKEKTVIAVNKSEEKVNGMVEDLQYGCDSLERNLHLPPMIAENEYPLHEGEVPEEAVRNTKPLTVMDSVWRANFYDIQPSEVDDKGVTKLIPCAEAVRDYHTGRIYVERTMKGNSGKFTVYMDSNGHVLRDFVVTKFGFYEHTMDFFYGFVPTKLVSQINLQPMHGSTDIRLMYMPSRNIREELLTKFGIRCVRGYPSPINRNTTNMLERNFVCIEEFLTIMYSKKLKQDIVCVPNEENASRYTWYNDYYTCDSVSRYSRVYFGRPGRRLETVLGFDICIQALPLNKDYITEYQTPSWVFYTDRYVKRSKVEGLNDFEQIFPFRVHSWISIFLPIWVLNILGYLFGGLVHPLFNWRSGIFSKIKVYRMSRRESPIYYLYKVECTDVANNRTFYLPKWALQRVSKILSERKFNDVWFGQTKTALSPILRQYQVPLEANHAIVLGMFQEYHRATGALIGDTLNHIQDYVVNYNNALGVKEPRQLSLSQWVPPWGYIVLVIAMLLLFVFFGGSLGFIALADFWPVLRLLAEESLKAYWPWFIYIIGLGEFAAHGTVGLLNALIHGASFAIPFTYSVALHAAYNLAVSRNWFFVLPLLVLVQFRKKLNFSFAGDFLISLMNQKTTLNEDIYFDEPLVFPQTTIKPYPLQEEWSNVSLGLKTEFVSPTTLEVNVKIERNEEKFSAHAKKRIDKPDQDWFVNGVMLIGFAHQYIMPRRQGESPEDFGALVMHRLKKVNSVDHLVLKQMWDDLNSFYRSLDLKYSEAILESFGLESHHGRAHIRISYEDDENKRRDMVANFSGQKKLLYSEAAHAVTEQCILPDMFTKGEGLKNMYKRVYKLIKLMEMGLKRDEILVKRGEIKPRPVFFYSAFVRAFCGAYLRAVKNCFYYTLPPFHALRENRIVRELCAFSTIEEVSTEVNSVYVGLKTDPVTISKWVNYQAVVLTKSFRIKDWLDCDCLVADGSTYDLSGDAKSVKYFVDFCEQNLGLPRAVASLIHTAVEMEKTVHITEALTIMKIADQFETGNSTTSLFNGLRNLASMRYSFEKHVQMYKSKYCLCVNGDDMFSMLDSKVGLKQLANDVTCDQLSMGVTSVAKVGKLTTVDYVSGTFVPAKFEGNPILLLTYKLGKFVKSGAVHAIFSKKHPYESLYETSLMWMAVSQHHPILNAWARFHNRLALSHLPQGFERVKLVSDSYVEWHLQSVADYYKQCRPYCFNYYMKSRYNFTKTEVIELIDYFNNLPLSTTISSHKLLERVIKIDME
jgi:hypothetical protein